MNLVWFDVGTKPEKCSYCHFTIDSRQEPIIIPDSQNEAFACFHSDCYSNYYFKAVRAKELDATVAWLIPAGTYRFSKW